jgi:hypothetical protein
MTTDRDALVYKGKSITQESDRVLLFLKGEQQECRKWSLRTWCLAVGFLPRVTHSTSLLAGYFAIMARRLLIYCVEKLFALLLTYLYFNCPCRSSRLV